MASTAIFSVRAFQALCTSSVATPVDQNLSSENIEGAHRIGISPTMSHARELRFSYSCKGKVGSRHE